MYVVRGQGWKGGWEKSMGKPAEKQSRLVSVGYKHLQSWNGRCRRATEQIHSLRSTSAIWRCTLMTPALGRSKQGDCELEGTLVCIVEVSSQSSLSLRVRLISEIA